LHQRTGDGIEHVEANARSDRSLRFVQMALLSSETTTPPSEQLIDLPPRPRHGVELILQLPNAALYLARLSPRLPARVPWTDRTHLFVTRGAASLRSGGTQGPRLAAGDAARITGESELWLGTGTTSEALIWTLAD
jgi:quercetin 2,3-dioxygenase